MLLLAFVGATAAMIVAVVVIARTGSDWADAGALVLLIVCLALIGAIIWRQLRD